MKSSITTTSVPDGASFGPSAEFPLVIRTRPTRSPALKTTPRKLKFSLPIKAGTKKVPRELFISSKNWIDVVERLSTSVKTAPKPEVVAGVVEPGTKKLTSTMVLPSAVNSRCGENVWKIIG